MCPEELVFADQNTDEILDEILKGAVALEKAQSRYSEMIEAGLQKNELTKVDSVILVRVK